MRSLVRLTLVIFNLIILYFLTKISPVAMVKNVASALFGAFIMVIVYIMLPHNISIIYQLLLVIICAITYIVSIMIFRENRDIIFNFKNLIVKK